MEKAFYLAGEALKELRDLRLYRDTHRSFEDYCRERFGHSRQKSNYLIAGAEIYQNLTTNRCQILPSTEYQVRPLKGRNSVRLGWPPSKKPIVLCPRHVWLEKPPEKS